MIVKIYSDVKAKRLVFVGHVDDKDVAFDGGINRPTTATFSLPVKDLLDQLAQRPLDESEYLRGQDEVELFSRAMLRELQANAYKGHWTSMSRRRQLYEIDYHAAKLKAAVRADEKPVRILEFAADLANHAMFVADTEPCSVGTGSLFLHTLRRRRTEPSFVKPKAGVYLRLLRNPRWLRKGLAGLGIRRKEQDHPEPRLRP